MESTEPWACPGHLARTARIGIAMHLGQIDKLKEREIDLFITDTKETDKRIKQLNRILSTLDGQGALALDED